MRSENAAKFVRAIWIECGAGWVLRMWGDNRGVHPCLQYAAEFGGQRPEIVNPERFSAQPERRHQVEHRRISEGPPRNPIADAEIGLQQPLKRIERAGRPRLARP